MSFLYRFVSACLDVFDNVAVDIFDNMDKYNNNKQFPQSAQMVCISHSQMGGLLLVYPH